MNDKTTIFLEQVMGHHPLVGGLFAGLSREELAESVTLSDLAAFKAGAFVFREGDEGNEMYVVAAGGFEVFRTDGHGRQVQLAVVGEGEMFGEIALLEHIHRTASVRALNPAMAFCFDRVGLGQRPDLTFKIYHNMARILAKRLRLTTTDLLLQEDRLQSSQSDGLMVGQAVGQPGAPQPGTQDRPQPLQDILPP